MKLVTFMRKERGREELGILREQRVLPLEELGFSFRDMNDLILRAGPWERAAMASARGEGLPLSEVRLLSPIPRPLQDVLCLGLNYYDHAAEASGFSKDAFGVELAAPIFFSKRVGYSQGTGAPIPAHRDLTEKLDFENELGVIIGRDADRVSEEEAPDYIFGYTVVNDVSAREVQTRHKQWYFGKSLEGFCPMGPCILTADEVAFPPRLRIWTTLNGELRQDSSTGCLIHGVAEIISTLSRGMVLRAGTVIATGTPKGVLMGGENPVFLRQGDEVVCAIEGIGELRNRVE
ncbi:MAG: fumarylacetoacetate hydrolase family protein [Oscillospiraceae bacterium]|nr:fumarylacetoacetate hydrolase family protein [Oscillospiraceae bacterium]